jgi:hypothetical protein
MVSAECATTSDYLTLFANEFPADNADATRLSLGVRVTELSLGAGEEYSTMRAEITVLSDFFRALGAIHVLILIHTSSATSYDVRMSYFTFSEIDFACIISKR